MRFVSGFWWWGGDLCVGACVARRDRVMSLWSSGRCRVDLCGWCRVELAVSRSDRVWCSKRCRQSAWRFARYVSRGSVGRGVAGGPATGVGGVMRFAYADPPYPGKAFYYPEKCEVDYVSLVATLVREFPDGWALSLGARDLRDVLPSCPPGARVGAWVKQPRNCRCSSAVSSWEPVIFVGGRRRQATVGWGVLDACVARGRFRGFPGAMVGMKPPAFSVWVFELLGASRGDVLVDLFPGSGAVGLAWDLFSRGRFGPQGPRRVVRRGQVSRGDPA